MFGYKPVRCSKYVWSTKQLWNMASTMAFTRTAWFLPRPGKNMFGIRVLNCPGVEEQKITRDETSNAFYQHVA